MTRRKQKLTAAEKSEKRRRREEYETIFVNGKQKRVKRRTIEGMDPDEFILRNADPVWLHQNGMWEYIHMQESFANWKEQGPFLDIDEIPDDLLK